MKKVKVWYSCGGYCVKDEIEVANDVTEDELEEIVHDYVHDFFEYGYEIMGGEDNA